ncbi:hypothetical protein HQQ81_21295 [Microbacteriaceae bacterium VKM Ac-2854]|nr:hypothetical protein [Microbacteriaceae bacterium VKM Ac-2854]
MSDTSSPGYNEDALLLRLVEFVMVVIEAAWAGLARAEADGSFSAVAADQHDADEMFEVLQEESTPGGAVGHAVFEGRAPNHDLVLMVGDGREFMGRSIRGRSGSLAALPLRLRAEVMESLILTRSDECQRRLKSDPLVPSES